MSALEHHHRYPAPSVRSGDTLAWQISRGAEAGVEPFLVGRLAQPRVPAARVAEAEQLAMPVHCGPRSLVAARPLAIL